ncbi:hypothetical protein VKT23_001118 [Stygiomarasmius scandens]|uniref:Uncharacterized protein n=1 Tax=Marasmiellus scandens TaxID=2682957 RepID=A0ABR1K8Q4_9AGAR
MGRWTQYDEDEYRLPQGLRRTGYDADTGQYHFSGEQGGSYKSAPYSRYRLSTQGGRDDVTNKDQVNASGDEFHPMDTIIEAATRVADRIIPPLQNMVQDAKNTVAALPGEVLRLGRSTTLPPRLREEEKLSDVCRLSRSVSLQSDLKDRERKGSLDSQRPTFRPSDRPLSRSVSLPAGSGLIQRPK